MNKWTWILLMIAVTLVVSAAGVIYWTSVKAKRIANSALDSGANVQTVLTPTPSPASSKTPTATISMPTSEVEGEDLSDVPRFNGAVRSSYDKNDDGSVINIEYYGQASSKEILEFYKTNLPVKEWILRAESVGALNFSKSEAEISIEIVDEDKTAKITQYKIHYFKVQTEE